MNDNIWREWLSQTSPLKPILENYDRTLLDIYGAIDDGAGRTVLAVEESTKEITSGIKLQSDLLTSLGQMYIYELCNVESLLDDMLHVLRKPLETAAIERLHRGLRALTNDWDDDAIEEFRETIRNDKYIAVAHLYLGIALEKQMQFNEAIEEYKLAMKYSVDDVQLTVRSSMLYLAAHNAAGLLVSDEIVHELVSKRKIRCSQLSFALGVITNNSSYFYDAIEVAPELAIDASCLSTSEADKAITTVQENKESTYSIAIRLLGLVQEVNRSVPEVLFHKLTVSGLSMEKNFSTATLPEVFCAAGSVLDRSVELNKQLQSLMNKELNFSQQLLLAREMHNQFEQEVASATQEAELAAEKYAKHIEVERSMIEFREWLNGLNYLWGRDGHKLRYFVLDKDVPRIINGTHAFRNIYGKRIDKYQSNLDYHLKTRDYINGFNEATSTVKQIEEVFRKYDEVYYKGKAISSNEIMTRLSSLGGSSVPYDAQSSREYKDIVGGESIAGYPLAKELYTATSEIKRLLKHSQETKQKLSRENNIAASALRTAEQRFKENSSILEMNHDVGKVQHILEQAISLSEHLSIIVSSRTSVQFTNIVEN
jgi:tetratricopeptide (TPR) repeat protein